MKLDQFAVYRVDQQTAGKCLYEVYGQEEHHVLEGKDIQ